jgi:hypothetical protein
MLSTSRCVTKQRSEVNRSSSGSCHPLPEPDGGDYKIIGRSVNEKSMTLPSLVHTMGNIRPAIQLALRSSAFSFPADLLSGSV